MGAPRKTVSPVGGIWDIVNEVRRRLDVIPKGIRVRDYYVPKIERVPYLNSIEVMGRSAEDLMVPNIRPGMGHLETMNRLLPLLPTSNNHVRRALTSIIGREGTRFIMHGETPGDRHILALWAFGHAPGASVMADENLILVTDRSGTYGIEDGKIVGGPYGNLPIECSISHALMSTKSDPLTDSRLRRLWLKVRRERSDPELALMTRIAYTRSLWDPRVMLCTFMGADSRAYRARAERLFKRIDEGKVGLEDTIKEIRRLLVPDALSSEEFAMLVPAAYNHSRAPAAVERAKTVLQSFLSWSK